MSDNDDDNNELSTHDKLVREYLDYYQAHITFNKKFSVRTHLTARRHLRKIIKLAKQRQKEIQTEFYQKRKTKPKNKDN